MAPTAQGDQAEVWYSYHSRIAINWQAQVRPSGFYPSPWVSPSGLYRKREPVEPPRYSRVLLTRLTDSIRFEVDHHFQGDRPAQVQANLAILGRIVLPGYWEETIVLQPDRAEAVSETGSSETAVATVRISDVLGRLAQLRSTLGIGVEPLEFYITPRVSVTVNGLEQPVRIPQEMELRLSFRSDAIEVQEVSPAEIQATLTHPLPAPTSAGGISGWLTALLLLGALLAVGLLLWRRLGAPRRLWERWLQRTWEGQLRSVTVQAERFAVPDGATLVSVQSLRQFAFLQRQLSLPVVQANGELYLSDGQTIYRLSLADR